MKKSLKVALLIVAVLAIDQCLKIWIKTNMAYGEEIKMLGQPWALIHFVENEGMAFGITLGGDHGKLALSLFRIAAVGFLIYYLRLLLRSKVSFGLIASFALILAGAVGNIIDSAVYGLIFSETPYHGGVATLFPEGGGYAGFLHGKVVDMFYFPIFEGFYPEWVPVWGGEHFLFFRPVFNVADASITTGVLSLLIFFRSFFSSQADQVVTDRNLAKMGEASLNPGQVNDTGSMAENG
ncbi:MAG: lipoprotein signal peptidase [Bacteroidetes bacterium]|nr:lipoprotein signal peptidase [Bacteroidota bacterium]